MVPSRLTNDAWSVPSHPYSQANLLAFSSQTHIFTSFYAIRLRGMLYADPFGDDPNGVQPASPLATLVAFGGVIAEVIILYYHCVLRFIVVVIFVTGGSPLLMVCL